MKRMFNKSIFVKRAYDELYFDNERKIYLFSNDEKYKFSNEELESDYQDNFKIGLLTTVDLTFDFTYEILNDILDVIINADDIDNMNDLIYEKEIIYYADMIRMLNDLNFFGLVDEKIKEKQYDDLSQCCNVAYVEMLSEYAYSVYNYINDYFTDKEHIVNLLEEIYKINEEDLKEENN